MLTEILQSENKDKDTSSWTIILLKMTLKLLLDNF